jgi:predicted metal-dependent hydrolase
VHVGGFDIHVTISARRRTIGLTVERDATIAVTVPPGVGDDEIVRRVTGKLPWLHRALRERAELGQPRPREFVTGEGFPYLGRSYRLLLVDEARTPVAFNGCSRRLEMRRDCAEDGAAHLARWYREQGKEFLGHRAAPRVQRMAVQPTELRVRKLGYRWGVLHCKGRDQSPLGRHGAWARPR